MNPETRKAATLLRIRQVCDDSVTRTGAVTILSVTAAGIVLILSSMLLPLKPSFSMALTTFLLTGAYSSYTLSYPDDSTLLNRMIEIEVERITFRDSRRKSDYGPTTKTKRKSSPWQNIATEVYGTRTQNWRSLRSTEFEVFLAAIFERQGFRVTLTKKVGDQGIDLILVKGNRRIGVQTKGYYHSVGNQAVQQAFTGKSFYDCDSCCVITNSRFTPHAVALATKVGCALIDEDGIPELMRGDMDI